MKDYLLEYCSQFNIQLNYKDGEQILIYCELIESIPTISIHQIFKNCPKVISDAFIDYFIKFNNTKNSINIIKDFANDINSSSEFIIKTPDENYKNFIQKYILPLILKQQSNSYDSKTISIDDNSDLTEGNINSIIQTDFSGNISNIDPSKGIYASDDTMVELDIVVEKFDT